MRAQWTTMLPTGRDLSERHDRVTFKVRNTHKERLDTYLLRRLGWSSRQKIQRLIQVGRVHVDSKAGKPALRLQVGQEIVVLLDPGGSEGVDRIPPPFWEDPYLLALNKPSGVLVHPVGRTTTGTVINELHARYKLSRHSGQRAVVPKLCHRLDRETSGMLLVAKTDFARRALQDAFEENRVSKGYWAVVHGVPQEEHFEVDLPVSTELDPNSQENHRLARIAPDGKASLTHFSVLARAEGFAVVECRPITGRQNQIRAHLAATGFPILGDVGFGSQKANWKHAELPFPERTLLHSCRLRFPHPVWGAEYLLEAPAPHDMRSFFAKWRS